MHGRLWSIAVCASLALLAFGCGDSSSGRDTAEGSNGTGGATGATVGTGGGVATGGSLSTGGSTASGGATTGGATVTGGATSTGGAGGATGGVTRINIDQGPLTMWYDSPANTWTEALPIGNGRLAAMIFGDPANGRLQLNESSFWSGGPSRNDNPNAQGVLDQVRQLIFDGQYGNAESLINSNFMSQLHGSKYQPIGDSRLGFTGHGNYSSYYRELDLERAVATTRYEVGGVTFTREVFASEPDQLIVIRLSADEAGSLTFSVSVGGPLDNGMNVLDANTLELTGRSSTHEGVSGPVDFDARVKVLNTSGTTT